MVGADNDNQGSALTPPTDMRHGRNSRSPCRTPEAGKKMRKRHRNRDKSKDGHRKRRRRSTSASSSTSSGEERRSRSRQRSERRRHKRSRKLSRRREHEHRASRTTERDGDGRRRRRSHTSRREVHSRADRQSTPFNIDTHIFLAELVKSLKSNRPEGNKFPMLGNVIPEFDPMVKGQTMQIWLNKVDECAKLYNWGDDQVIHYALPKLSGVAKTWYQALPTMSFSWPEWRNKLIESFPSSDDYAELLTEMLAKRVRYNESLELYYYEKINLLNRCEIYGKRAVDCLLYGLEDRSLRLGAKAAKCQEPEQVLEYFQSIKQQPREFDRVKVLQDKRAASTSLGSKQVGTSDSRPSRSNTSITCFNCNEPGHYSFKCTKAIIKCNICNRLGHLSDNCTKVPNSNTKACKAEKSTEKSVMKVDTNSTSDSKYSIQLKINGTATQGYVDLGSQCTLVRRSEAIRLGITWVAENLPIMRGIGNNIVVPLGSAHVDVEIQGILENVQVFIVEDSVIKHAVLVGHSFTEKPGIVITKTPESLIFDKTRSTKLKLSLQLQTTIQPRRMVVLPVSCGCNYSGTVYVKGTLRGQLGYEFYLLPGEYAINDGSVGLLAQNVSDNVIYLYKDTLITRAVRTNDFIHVNMLDYETLDTDIKYGEQLNNDEVTKLKNLLKKYAVCFSSSLKDLGLTNVVQMQIELTDMRPVVYRPYRLSYPEREVVRSMVQEMIDADIVCESGSPYASPILLVQKKTGEKRLCVDYRALNNKTRKEHYPLPLIDDQLDRLAGNSLFISLDLASGYYQIPIAEDSQDKTSFVTPDGQYQFKRMPFGLANAPSVFQRTMNKVLSNSKVNYIVIYMDDILIPACSFEEGMARLEEVLNLLNEAGLTLKLGKCQFFCRELHFLGFHVSGEGIRPGSRKTIAISNFPTPQNAHDVRRFIGLASFFRRFVKDFALLASPLTDLLKSNFKWKWTDEQAKAFESLKRKLVERPILALYDAELETELHTDASKIGIAGILMQRNKEGLLRPVAYYSRKTTNDEQKLHSFELETLAVVASLSRFRVYLLGLKFKIVTDCNALRTTLTKKDLIPRIARWWVQFQEYDCEIEYRPGSRMAHVDALSRGPVTETTPESESHVIDVLSLDIKDWIATVQNSDDEVKRLKEILQDGETKFIADVHKNYQLRGNHVYRTVENGVRWVVPRGVRWQVLRMNHDDVGHFGFEKTLSRLQGTFWFPKMRRFTKKYVASCLECAHHKAPGGPKEGMLHPIPKIEMPFHTLHADHLGPFVRSKRGNTYVLVIIDAFTKFINIRAVRDTKTTTAIKVFKEHFSYFGAPSRLITDRGTCFTSAKFKDFTSLLKIKHILNAVATPRANGQVERFNRTISDALSTKCHGKNDNTWDEYIGDIQLGINTTVNKTTGKSASELLFGCKLVNATENILSDVINVTSQHVSGEVLTQLRSVAKNRIDMQQEISKRNFDMRRKKGTSYKIGDLIRIERTITDKEHIGKSKKLIAKFHGPYRILKILPNDRFLVEDTPLTRKGNKRYENVVALDKVHPWLNFNDYSSDGSESDGGGNSRDTVND